MGASQVALAGLPGIRRGSCLGLAANLKLGGVMATHLPGPSGAARPGERQALLKRPASPEPWLPWRAGQLYLHAAGLTECSGGSGGAGWGRCR